MSDNFIKFKKKKKHKHNHSYAPTRAEMRKMKRNRFK